MNDREEPVVQISVNGAEVTLLGTAHVSKASADKVRELLAGGDYDAVAVELCPSRYNAIIDPDSLARMDLFRVVRDGKVPMVTASLALGAYQQRLADQFGIEPGAEMRAAIASARDLSLPVLLIDREVGTTLKRVYRNVPWWRRFALISGLAVSVFSREEVGEDEIERLKEGDILETTFAQFAEQARDLYGPLIEERDRYMAARLADEIRGSGYRRILAVVGAGHLRGIAQRLPQVDPAGAAAEVARLETMPPPARWPRLLPWVVVALVVAGFALGFRRGADIGVSMVVDWIVINGGLSALGAIIAAAHPLTIVTAFLAAPLTSLNPTIGAGMVTAAVEISLRRPQVGDFGRLRSDTTHPRGWWRNRVARVLLVFVFSTLGSAIGTYVAGFRIFDRLVGG
jgi:pheromone shutdown-related protein TraB